VPRDAVEGEGGVCGCCRLVELDAEEVAVVASGKAATPMEALLLAMVLLGSMLGEEEGIAFKAYDPEDDETRRETPEKQTTEEGKTQHLRGPLEGEFLNFTGEKRMQKVVKRVFLRLD